MVQSQFRSDVMPKGREPHNFFIDKERYTPNNFGGDLTRPCFRHDTHVASALFNCGIPSICSIESSCYVIPSNCLILQISAGLISGQPLIDESSNGLSSVFIIRWACQREIKKGTK